VNRESKFRGMNDETGEWVYGYYTKLMEGARIFDAIISDNGYGDLTRFYIHRRETIGQYTGLHDNKRTAEYPEGQEIYEEDIMQEDALQSSIVYWDKKESRFALRGVVSKRANRNWVAHNRRCVIGNRFDNPELLNE